MRGLHAAFCVAVVALLMTLAIIAVPFPGSLLFLVAIAGGAGMAFWRLRGTPEGSE